MGTEVERVLQMALSLARNRNEDGLITVRMHAVVAIIAESD